MITNPRYAIQELGLTTLVGADDQVDQNDYGASIAITLGDGIRPVSGELLSFMFFTLEEGTGAIQSPAGSLLIFDADPTVSAGDTALAGADHIKILGRVDVAAADWITDANGGNACKLDQPIPFHSLQTLYVAWFHSDATSLNDLAGDDEYLRFNAWYRRDT